MQFEPDDIEASDMHADAKGRKAFIEDDLNDVIG
jgi:hypothetical protein